MSSKGYACELPVGRNESLACRLACRARSSTSLKVFSYSGPAARYRQWSSTTIRSRKPVEEGGQFRGLIAVHPDVDHEAQPTCRLPEPVDTGAIQPAPRRTDSSGAPRMLWPRPYCSSKAGLWESSGSRVTDAGHPIGVGPHRIEEKAVVPAIIRGRLDREDLIDARAFPLPVEVCDRPGPLGRAERLGDGRIEPGRRRCRYGHGCR